MSCILCNKKIGISDNTTMIAIYDNTEDEKESFYSLIHLNCFPVPMTFSDKFFFNKEGKFCY